jgi:Uma2 family endonuclease
MALEQPWMMTLEEYFELEERDPDTRHEYVDGYVYAMAGGTFNHNTISANIHRILWNRLRGSSCRVYNSDMKVHIAEKRYWYPDVTVSCDPGDRGTGQVLVSPRVVIEVLSPSTEMKDRTWKLKHYLACPTIEEYLLVDAKSQRVEIYRREKTTWRYSAFEAGDEIELLSLGVHFPIEEAYVDVEFGEEALEDTESED